MKARTISQEEAKATRRQLDTLQRLLTLQHNGHKPAAVETVKDGRDIYRYELWGATDASGGILVRVFRSPVNRSASVDATPFDDMRDASWSVDHRIAYERLRMARMAAYQAA